MRLPVCMCVYLCVGLPGASVSCDHSMRKRLPEGISAGVCCVLVHLLHIRWSVVQLRVALKMCLMNSLPYNSCSLKSLFPKV